MDLMFAPLRKYAQFEGRARRTEYWLWALFRLMLVVLFMIPFVVLVNLTEAEISPQGPYALALGILMLLGGAVWLALFIPDLAVSVRRLHDANMSGWLLLLHIVPFGGFVLFVFSVLDGTPGRNIYGADPKRPDASTASIFA